MHKVTYILIAIVAGVLLSLVSFNTSVTAVAPGAEAQPAKVPETVEEWIDYYATKYELSPTLRRDLKNTGWCESGFGIAKQGDWSNKEQKYLAYSVFQIHRPTFNAWSNKLGKKLDYNNYVHHIELAAWAFSQGESYRNDWSMYVALKNGGTFSFYSNLLGKHFTITCIAKYN